MQDSLPDRGHLTTEQRLRASAAFDALGTEAALRLINSQDAEVPVVVRTAIPAIAKFVNALVPRMRSGGRLIYIGAGTSGRLGVLDASECPPTYQCDPGTVTGIIAGGDSALRSSSEGAEDDPDGARDALDKLALNESDALVGIMAGGTTPYVWGALKIANERKCLTSLICCVYKSQLQRMVRAPLLTATAPLPEIDPSHGQLPEPVGHLIELPVGAEVVTGSTRMKAGTATKLTLNMISTTVMTQLGKVWGNLMVDLRATNDKLRDRAARIIGEQCSVNRDEALEILERAAGSVKIALVMTLKGTDAAEAQRLIDANDGRLRPILGDPR